MVGFGMALGASAQIYNMPYSQNFDAFPADDINFGPGAEPFPLVEDWINEQANDDAQDWYGRTVATGSSGTGPSADHTSGTGTYMYVEDGFGSFTNVSMTSPGIDATLSTGGIELNYWAHSWTSGVGNGMVVYATNDLVTWTQVDSFGILSATDQWFQRSVDLTAFSGDTIYVRWAGANNVNSFGHDIAIDDVSFVETVFQGQVSSITNIICNGDSTGQMTVATQYGVAPLSYSWSNGATTDTLFNAPAGAYCVTIVDANMDTIVVCDTIIQNSLIESNVTATSIVCIGDSTGMVNLDSIWGGIPIVQNCGLSTLTCDSIGGVVQADNSTAIQNGTTGYPAIFGNYYWGARHQFVYRASELAAAGYLGGNIDSIGIPIIGLGGSTAIYENFSVKMGCTADSVLSATWIDGLTEVFPATTINVSVDTIWIAFPTPYYWDGVSNLALETCFNNSNYTNNTITHQTAVGYQASHYYRADNTAVCGANNTSGFSNNRPNVLFGNCSATPSSIPYNVAWSTGASDVTMIDSLMAGTYSVTITDAAGCSVTDSSTIINNTPISGVAGGSFCEGDSLTVDAGAGFDTYAWSNGDSTQTSVITLAGTYNVTVTDSIGCVSMDSALVVENTLPTPAITGLVDTICANGSMILDAGAGFSTYSWTTSGSAQTETVSGAALPLGDNTVTVTVSDSNGCVNTDAVTFNIDACASIDELNAIAMSIYPNPSTGVFNYSIDNMSGNITMMITDLSGKIVDAGTITSANGTFDLTRYQAGTYILKLQAGDAVTIVRLVKN